uniref:Uncharacterized protein n=1 Tax=Candidatus Kentrum sp. TC TaxID=2126339 RepID=A0A450Z5P6_9GAMM|nr:MAG: hypothetical protein BECKTC1821D_GA0114238_106814 [Candidatus Kentron sp. TC]
MVHFPDWETLPYDIASPHQDIVSERLSTLYRLPDLTNGILALSIPTLMMRIAPRDYLEASSLILAVDDSLDLKKMRQRLAIAGYRVVGQVMEHGEFPMTEKAIEHFRASWRGHFPGNPTESLLYRDISNGVAPSGIEYYLPLFFDATATLFDYLPVDALIMIGGDALSIAETFKEEVRERFEQRQHDQQFQSGRKVS